jgi:hypothetical protein
MELQYEQDLYIDEGSLDVECLDQPSLMFRYSKALAKAEKDVSLLKEKIGVEEARLDRDIRTNPTKYKIGDIKITEAVVSGTILVLPEIRKLRVDVIEAQYEVSMIKGAVDSVRQRKDMLQELIKLHGQNYFAGPSVPRNLSQEVKQQHLKTQSNSAVIIKRRTK